MTKSLQQIIFDFPGINGPAPPTGSQPAVKKNENTADRKPVIIRNAKPKQVAAIAQGTGAKRGRKSLKEADQKTDLIQIPEDEILFKKQYYSIGEVAAMFAENPSLIRFWETEFDILQPRKNRKGDRFFRPIDIKNLLLIYDLLRRRKFTIEGAREYLKMSSKAEEKFAAIQSLEKIKSFLLELKASL